MHPMLAHTFCALLTAATSLAVAAPACPAPPGKDSAAWFELTDLPHPRAMHMTAFMVTDSGSRVFTFGGQRSPSSPMEQACLAFSPVANSWLDREPMRYRRGLGQAVVVRGLAYVMGGSQAFGSALSKVEAYDPQADEWSVAPDMPESLCDFGAVVWRDSLIYVLGGGNWAPHTPPSNRVWLFDPASNSWRPVEPLPCALGAPGCGISGDTILVACGWTDSGTTNLAWRGLIDTADPTIIYWQAVDTLPGPRRCRPAGGVSRLGLFLVGGISFADTHADSSAFPRSATVLSDAWSLSSGTGTWRRWPDKPEPVTGVGAVAVSPHARLYVPGGYPGTAPYLNALAVLDAADHSRDVGVSAILSPAGRLEPGVLYPLTATFMNAGRTSEEFSAQARLVDSISGQVLLDADTTMRLDAGVSRTIEFGSFTPQPDRVFNAVVAAVLSGDENPENDTCRARARTTSGSDPDGFGYIYESTQEPDSLGFEWVDTAGSTRIEDWEPNPDDGCCRRTLPFEFPFYDDSVRRIYVCTNGFLTDSGDILSLNCPLPFAEMNSIIAPFWDDLTLRDSGAVYELASSDRVVFTWLDVPRYGDPGSRVTFQVVLHSNGAIRFNYLSLRGDSATSTVGIQDDHGYWRWYSEYVYDGMPASHEPADSVSVVFHLPGVAISEPEGPARHGGGLPAIFAPTVCSGPVFIRLQSFVPCPAPLSVFDASGRLVRVLPVPYLLSTVYSSVVWDLRDNHGRTVPPGAYFLRFSGQTRKLLLVVH